jgi:hypothetical protein
MMKEIKALTQLIIFFAMLKNQDGRRPTLMPEAKAYQETGNKIFIPLYSTSLINTKFNSGAGPS